MNVPNFASILDRPITSLEKPKPLPQGTYLMMVQGQAEVGKSSKKQTDQVKFTFKFLKASDDVDQDELKELGGLKDKTLSNNTTTFYITEAAGWRLRWFLDEVLQIPTHDEEETDDNGQPLERTPRQMLAEVAGKQFWAKIKHESSEDGKQTFMAVADMAALGSEEDDDE
jgi:hypothetical protein